MEIKKLADIIEWADGIIRDAGYNEEKYQSDGSTAYCHVKAHELWRIRDVVLDGMQRHAVYTNALNQDIAAKSAKIDLMQKELDGRKEGYWALKEKYDKLEKEVEELHKKDEDRKDRIKELESEYVHVTKYNNMCQALTLRDEEIDNLKKEIEERKNAFNDLREEMANRYIAIETHYDICKTYENGIEKLKVDLIHEREKNEKLAKAHAELENDMRYKTIIEYQDIIASLNKEIDYYKNQERIRTDQLRATESKVYELQSAINVAAKMKEDDHGKSGFKRYIEYLIEEEERAVPERFKERLNEEITAIFTKEEETEVKGNGRTSSGRYPWGAKVRCRKPDGIYCSYNDECCRKPENFNCDFKDDIPCGEDAIE